MLDNQKLIIKLAKWFQVNVPVYLMFHYLDLEGINEKEQYEIVGKALEIANQDLDD